MAYDYRRKRHVAMKPKQDFLNAAIGNFFIDLKNVKYNDPELVKALKFAMKSTYQLNDFHEGEQPPPKKFCENGAERKAKVPDVRDALCQWFIIVRETLKGRLPIKNFRSKCHQVYAEWLKQQSEPVSDEQQLKFGKYWIQDRMEEYNVSLRNQTSITQSKRKIK